MESCVAETELGVGFGDPLLLRRRRRRLLGRGGGNGNHNDGGRRWLRGWTSRDELGNVGGGLKHPQAKEVCQGVHQAAYSLRVETQYCGQGKDVK